jgi:hypothetical protein
MNVVQRRLTLDSIEERQKLFEEEQDLKKSIQTIKRNIGKKSVDVGEKFYKYFEKSIEKLTTNNNKQIQCCMAIFQADSVKAGRMISGHTDILLTSDTDQAALLGDRCLAIKKYQYKPGKKSTIDSLEIFTPCKKTLNATLKMINLPLDSELVSKAKYPIFQNIGCPRLRGLIAVGLGCDVNLHSVVTPTVLLSFLSSEMIRDVSHDDAYLALKKFYTMLYNKTDKHTRRKSKKTTIVSHNVVDNQKCNEKLDIYTDAFIYEPTNEINDTTKQITYIHSAPPDNKLHPYLKEFITNTHFGYYCN